MSLISFANPDMLFLLLLVPLIIIIHIISLMSFKKKSMKFANFETIKRLTDDQEIFSKNILHLIIRIIYVIMLVLAISGMGINLEKQGVYQEIIFAIDASGSMLAEDIKPNRMDASKYAIEQYVANNTFTAPIGLVTFTSLVFVEVDPTMDKLVVLSGLDEVAIRKTSGTSLGTVINYAPQIFSQEDRAKALVIFTDGQENILDAQELEVISSYAKSRDVSVHLIGVATEDGAAFTNGTAGPTILNKKNLQTVAEANGGSYSTILEAGEIPAKLQAIFQPIDVEKHYDISFYLFMVSFVVLIIEWYFANYFAKAFPS